MSDRNLLKNLARYIGKTVTVFSTSGGASGCGFTGILMSVNPCYIRILTQEGTPPANPLSPDICPGTDGCINFHQRFNTGSVCDIPVFAIASFCHNAI